MVKLTESIKSKVKNITFGIHKKIFFYNAVSCFILSIAISITVMNMTTGNMRELIYMTMKAFTQQLSNNIENHFLEIKNTVFLLSEDKRVSLFMSNKYANEDERYDKLKELSTFLFGIKWMKKYSDIILISFSGNIMSTSYTQIRTLEDTQVYKWYSRLMESNKNYEIISNFSDITEDARNNKRFMYAVNDVSYAVALKYPVYATKNLGVIVMKQNVGIFDIILKNINNEAPFDTILIYDQSGYMIYNSNKKTKDSFILSERDKYEIINSREDFIKRTIGEKKYIVTTIKNNISGWSIVALSSEERISEKLESLNRSIILVTIASMIIVFIFSYFVSVKLSGPLRKLAGLMRTAGQRKYNIGISQNSNDEMGELADSFNFMIKELLENQILRKEAEIRALQHQINPHFLYNTLELINSYAILNGQKEISMISRNMGDIFRYTVGGNKNVTIRDELEYVQKYIEIHKIKGRSRFDVEYDIDKEVMDCTMEKFVLQPLIENALTHGLENVKTGGLITLAIKKVNNMVNFEVTDNGEGIEQEKLGMLDAYMSGEGDENLHSNKKSIGLKNVNMRFVLKYGRESGLKIYSYPGLGTKIVFNIPYQENEVNGSV